MVKRKKAGKGKKILAPTEPENHDNKHPSFSFKYLLTDYISCTAYQMTSLLAKLHNISQLKWKEWKTAPRKGIGYEKIPRDSLNVGIPRFVSDDVRHFLAFRFTEGRTVGIRKGTIFYIIWIDCKLKLYNHE